MPPRLDPYPRSTEQLRAVYEEDFEYQYPYGLDLRPQASGLHRTLVNRIMDRARESYEVMSARHASWRKIDHTLTAYIPADQKERQLESKDERKPVSIVVPVSFAVLETLLTYWCQALLEDPIFQCDPMGPEDTVGAIMLERLMEQQAIRNKMALALHTQFRDGLAYGMGIVTPQWHQHTYQKTVQRPTGINVPLLGFVQTGLEQVTVDRILYEGNRLRNIDPYRFMPDPNVACHNVQDGEFVAWLYTDNLVGLLDAEHRGVDGLFNVRSLTHLVPAYSAIRCDSDTGRETRSGMSRDHTQNTRPVDVVVMYTRLVPREWELGDSDRPEMWEFRVAGDEVLIGARRCEFRHGMFPVTVCAPDFDGYSIAPISRIETIYGLQKVLDFLLNQHVANQRKAGNDMLVADPSIIHVPSLEDPEPGRVILVEREYWGRPGATTEGLRQLQFHDVTRQNVQDAAFVVDMIQRVSAATDSVQGIVREGSERRTATEVGVARQSSLSRLQKSVKMGAIQSMYDLGLMLACNTQQFMTADQYIRVAGRWEETLRNEFGVMDQYLLVSPNSLDIHVDILPRNGAIPGGTNIQGFMQWLQLVLSNPQTAPFVDFLRASKHVARELGAWNVDDFLRAPAVQTQVLPDAAVQAGAERGDLVPLDAGNEGGVF